MITVSEIVIYPIKSLRGVSVPNAKLESRGFRYDRRWMLVDDDGVFLTQRKLSELALFDVAIASDSLQVSKAGHGTCSVPLLSEGETRAVTVWNDTVQAIEPDHEASVWFSDALRTRCALVHMPDSADRRLYSREGIVDGLVSFADTNPVLIASTASLDDLNARLPEPIPMRRFRPNLVLEGCRPFEEDEWSALRIGRSELKRSMRCARCLVTTIDIETARPSDEPLRTLATFRKDGTHVWFGTYYAPHIVGEIAVGQSVTAT